MRTTTAFFIVVICAAAGLLFLARGTEATGQGKEKEKDKPPAPAVTKWEYKLVDKGIGEKPKDISEEFDGLGAEGWELVTAYLQHANAGSIRFHFKRPKQ